MLTPMRKEKWVRKALKDVYLKEHFCKSGSDFLSHSYQSKELCYLPRLAWPASCPSQSLTRSFRGRGRGSIVLMSLQWRIFIKASGSPSQLHFLRLESWQKIFYVLHTLSGLESSLRWRGGSTVKNMHYSIWGSRFGSQCSDQATLHHPYVTQAPEESTPSGFLSTCTHMHTPTHRHNHAHHLKLKWNP